MEVEESGGKRMTQKKVEAKVIVIVKVKLILKVKGKVKVIVKVKVKVKMKVNDSGEPYWSQPGRDRRPPVNIKHSTHLLEV